MAISRKKTNPVLDEFLQTQEQFHRAMRRLVDTYTKQITTLDPTDQARLKKFIEPYQKLGANPFTGFKKEAEFKDQVVQLDDIMRSNVKRLEQAYEAAARQQGNFLAFLNEKQIRVLTDEAGKQFDASKQLIKPAHNLIRYKSFVETVMKPGGMGYSSNDVEYKKSHELLANLLVMLNQDITMINRRAAHPSEQGMFKRKEKAKEEVIAVLPLKPTRSR